MKARGQGAGHGAQVRHQAAAVHNFFGRARDIHPPIGNNAGPMDSALLEKATVAEAMQPFDRVSPDLPMTEAAALMRSHHCRALIVETEDGSPAIFTEYDVVKVISAGEPLEGKVVGDHHTRVAIAATPEWPLGRAADTMIQGRFPHLVVVDQGKTVGLLEMRYILELMLEPTDHPEPPRETVEFSAQVREDAGQLLHDLRRGAKQHMSATKCRCELDWTEILIGQVEDRPDLSHDELVQLWEARQHCPVLYSMGGGGD